MRNKQASRDRDDDFLVGAMLPAGAIVNKYKTTKPKDVKEWIEQHTKHGRSFVTICIPQ